MWGSTYAFAVQMQAGALASAYFWELLHGSEVADRAFKAMDMCECKRHVWLSEGR